MLFDTHCHLNDIKYKEDMQATIFRSREEGTTHMCTVGFDLPSSQKAVEIAEQYKGIYAAVGIHPHDATTFDDKVEEALRALTQSHKVVAYGEIGLDYYRNLSPKEDQQKVLRKQIALAKELKLPIIIHDRDAHEDILTILQREKAAENGGIFHCYSGSFEMARTILKMGFHISFAGPVTFPNAVRLQDVVKLVPLERMLIETDSPYLTPQTFRGKRNEPAYVRFVAEKIAELKNIAFEKVAEQTFNNALQVYRIAI
jgi:TatD DNase family protein